MSAIPMAVLTAHPGFGRWFGRLGVCAIPEELFPPDRNAGTLFALSRRQDLNLADLLLRPQN